MNYSVTIIEKEYRPKVNTWVTEDIYFWVTEANNKQHARKLALEKYPNRQKYRIGKVSTSSKKEGIYYPEYKTLKKGNPKVLQQKDN